ncbi:MAG: YqaA family protein [Nitrososphaerota archaeon]
MLETLLEWANGILGQYGILALIALSFMEASFFPIPPDVLLIPMCLSSPQMSLLYGFITTFSSAVGALFGYWIGLKGGRPLLLHLVSKEKVAKVEEYFNKYGLWAVGISAFTPIPYKVFTIASGVFRLQNLLKFFLVSLVGRGGRFMIVAALIMQYGEMILDFVTQSFTNLTLVVAGAVIAIYLSYYFMKKILQKKMNA